MHHSKAGEEMKLSRETIQKHEDEFNKIVEILKEAGRTNSEVMSDLTKDILFRIVETFKPLKKFQQEWVSFVLELQIGEENNPFKKPLLVIKDGSITFNNKKVLARNKKELSQSFILLKILLLYSDSNGFISYEEIEKHFVEYKLGKKKTKEEANERVRNTKKDIHRFLGIPNKHEGIKIIVTIKGKGLKLNNPRVLMPM